MGNNYEERALVKKFLPHWQKYLKKNGPVKTLYKLKQGGNHVTMISHKDRMGLIAALGLEGK